MFVYPGAEDSVLLSEYLKTRKCKRMLDMGCGTGILANSIGHANEIYCVDINPDAIEFCKKTLGENKKMKFLVSDLFEKISEEERFDLIVFNTPYLDDEEPHDYAWTYIQNGEDIIKKFILQAINYLEKEGEILILISDRGYEDYKKFCEDNKIKWEKIIEKELFFEKLFVVRLSL
jgi:release factor glutamine methyltransferase